MNRFASSVLILWAVLFFISSCGPKKTKEQLYAEALQYEREENFKEAIKTYQIIVDEYPQAKFADSVLFNIGQIYSNNLTDFESSIEAHKSLIKKFPKSKIRAQSLFMIGYHYANNINDLEKAREYYQKFLETYPDNELSTSVQWELDHLGQDINEIEFLKNEPVEEVKQESTTSDIKNTN